MNWRQKCEWNLKPLLERRCSSCYVMQWNQRTSNTAKLMRKLYFNTKRPPRDKKPENERVEQSNNEWAVSTPQTLTGQLCWFEPPPPNGQGKGQCPTNTPKGCQRCSTSGPRWPSEWGEGFHFIPHTSGSYGPDGLWPFCSDTQLSWAVSARTCWHCGGWSCRQHHDVPPPPKWPHLNDPSPQRASVFFSSALTTIQHHLRNDPKINFWTKWSFTGIGNVAFILSN